MAETRTVWNGMTETNQITRRASGLEFQRRFTDGKVSPFDKVEWERRTALIGNDKGQVIFRQENVEVPKSWSHDGDEHRRFEIFSRQAQHTGARNLGAAIDRPRGEYDCALGRGGRLLRHARIARRFPRRADAPAGRAEDGFQFAGVVQRGRAAQAAVLGVLHQFRAGQHGFDHGPGQDGRDAVQVGLRNGHEFLHRCAAARKRFRAAASLRGR